MHDNKKILVVLLLSLTKYAVAFTASDCVPGETWVADYIKFECFQNGRVKGYDPRGKLCDSFLHLIYLSLSLTYSYDQF